MIFCPEFQKIRNIFSDLKNQYSTISKNFITKFAHGNSMISAFNPLTLNKPILNYIKNMLFFVSRKKSNIVLLAYQIRNFQIPFKILKKLLRLFLSFAKPLSSITAALLLMKFKLCSDFGQLF